MSSNEDSGAAIYSTLMQSSEKNLKKRKQLFLGAVKTSDVQYSKCIKYLKKRKYKYVTSYIELSFPFFPKEKVILLARHTGIHYPGLFPGKLISSIWLSGSHQCKKFQEIWPLTGQKFFLPLCAGILKQSMWGLGIEQEQGCRTGTPVLEIQNNLWRL